MRIKLDTFIHNTKIIPDSRIRNIVSKGPKYRFPSQIYFNRCREEIASALNDFGNRWCKRESCECNAMKEWKLSIFSIVDKRIKFYSADGYINLESLQSHELGVLAWMSRSDTSLLKLKIVCLIGLLYL